MAEFPKLLFEGDFRVEKVQPTFEHAHEIFEIIDSQRDYMAEWLGWVDYTNCAEDAYPHMRDVCNPESPAWHITHAGKIIGAIDFVRVSERHKTVEIGYWLSKDFNGRGIMTCAVRALEKFAFEQMGMNRVEIRTDVRNMPSQGVPMRCDYVREGVLRASYVLRGNPCDVVVFSKLKSEWEKEQKNA